MKSGWLDNDTFEFFVPASVVAKSSSSSSKKDGRRWIQGIASTNAKDLQGEVVVQHGIDFDYFLKHGYFNNDHKPGFENKVGQPTECKVTNKGLWVKGFLFQDHEVANGIWDLMQSLEKTPGSSRKVGFSIQGKVKKREGNVIKECWIQDIAITACPVNTTTWSEIVKSLACQSSPSEDLKKDQEGKDEEEEKALTSSSPVTSVESLDSKLKVTAPLTKSLSLDEAVAYVQERYGLSTEAATNVVDVVFQSCEQEIE